MTMRSAFPALMVAHRDGRAERVDDTRLTERNQFALEMDHMVECVQTGRVPHPPAKEGLQDQRAMDAIYRSAVEGRPVAMPRAEDLDTTRGPAPEAA